MGAQKTGGPPGGEGEHPRHHHDARGKEAMEPQDPLEPPGKEHLGRPRRVDLLAERLDHARRWLQEETASQHPALGYFGASTGAAAALVAEADHPHSVAAIVSRGGRPDLAGEALARVTAPTLLIVGGADSEVLELNREALARLHGGKKLVVVPGATHLFEEPGTLEQVARLASEWFTTHLREGTTAHGT